MDSTPSRPRPNVVLLLAAVGTVATTLVLVVHEFVVHDDPWVVATLVTLLLCTVQLGFELVRQSRRNRRYRILGDLAARVNRAILLDSDTNTIFTTILDEAFQLLEGVDHGSVLTFVEPHVLGVAASRGFPDSYLNEFRIRLLDTWQYQQTRGEMKDAIIVDKRLLATTPWLDSELTWFDRSVISAPLYVGDQLYGLISIDAPGSKAFGEDDLELMRWLRVQIEVGLRARHKFETSLEDLKMDGLTQVLSRAAFEDHLQAELELAASSGRQLTLGMFDADGLKAVNDAHGHLAGDALLKTMADALRGATRASDLLGRYGGDEFIALFHRTEVDTMVGRMEHLLAQLATPGVSFSYGFAQFPADGTTIDSLVAAADKRLYAVKSSRSP